MASTTSTHPTRKGSPPKGWVDEFIRWLEACPNVSRACRGAGIDRKTAYNHRKRYPSFAARWEEALQFGISAAEDEAWRRAQHGTIKPVFHKGAVCGHIREFDNGMLMKMLAAHKPEVYRNQFDVRQIVDMATVDLERAAHEIGLDEEQIDTLLELMSERLR